MKEEQIRELLEDMSTEEKIGQLLQLTGAFYADEGLATGPMQQMHLSQEQVEQAGSVLSTVGAATLKKIQTAYMEKQPHHIPLMFMADVINGYRTVFPIPLALGCSFDPEIMRKTSEISAREMARAGVHVTFSPMVDLVRDARWGRVMESTIDAPNHPLYVFGYGLDYTEYRYDNLVLDGNQVTKDRPITVSVDVRNAGKRAGKEVVQMYLQDLVGSVARPVRELKGFEKVALSAGEKKTITFTITEEMLRFYDRNMNYVSEPGEFKVYVGGNSDAELSAGFQLV